MANISILSRLINGVQRNVDLSANTLVVDAVKVGGASGTDLTKAILDRLIALQNGSDVDATYHTHDGRYFTEAELSSATASSGSDLIGDDATYTNVTPAAATVKGALSGIDSAIGTEIAARQAADTTLQNNIDAEETRALAAEGVLDAKIDQEISDRAADVDAEETRALAAEAALAQDIADEEAARIAADAALQAAINASASNLSWREGAKAATGDAGLNAAADDTALSTLLPFSDDDAPEMVIGDFAAGDRILSKNGASSKIFRVWDDAGTLKVTTAGVDALAANDTFLVMNDLPDSPANQEGAAIYTWTGADLVKVGDMDWSLATGIDLSASFTSTTGVVAVGDSVELAIAKLVGNLAAEITNRAADVDAEETRALAAEAALDAAIDQEILDRAADVDAEETRALAAEAALDAAIDQEILDRAADVDAEEARALAAEAALDSRIDALEVGGATLSRDFTAGEAFAADASFLVRMAVNGETAGRVYKASNDASVSDHFYAFGVAKSVAGVAAGAAIRVTFAGTHTLGANDTAFNAADIGKPVYLGASGALTVTPPTATDTAVVRVGIVETTTSVMVAAAQLNGIN
jgi:hypothetical protein